MAQASIEFHFDFGAPNSYLVHKVIPAVSAESGIRFDYVPMLLGGVFRATGNQPPAIALKGIKNKPEYGVIETRRFCAAHGIEPYRMNPHFPVNTLKIMRGAVHALDKDYFPRYADAMYAALWEQGLKMDEDALILEVLTDAGLPAEEIMAASQDQVVKDALVANTEATVARGTFGAPTLFVGDEIFFGKDKLRDAVEWAQR